jgi:hypothetical protein
MDIAFDDFAVIGTTTRRLDPAGDRWRVGWYPEGGQGAEPNIDGVFLDGRFIEINYGVDERGPFLGRLVVYDITRDHFRVRKDRLYDDGALAPEIWVYEATRAAAD